MQINPKMVPISRPYLRASDIALMPESIPENGLIAKVKD